jgi:hypothetical protein
MHKLFHSDLSLIEPRNRGPIHHRAPDKAACGNPISYLRGRSSFACESLSGLRSGC